MKFDKLFICSALAFSICSCSDDNEPVEQITPTPGKEVSFGADINSTDVKTGSKTIYGPENTTNHSFPIYWENGDEVKVYSPQSAVNEATYKVSIKDATGQNFASTLDKVTDAGIQWGNAPTADFYSVYPAGQVQAYDNAAKKVTVRLPHMQNDYISVDDASSAHTALADMQGGFLFAQTLGVANGTPTVNLRYKPISTALRFTLTGPSSTTGGSANKDEVTISNIVITAPSTVTLAGNFDINFPTEEGKTPTYTVAQPDGTNTFNRVTVYSSYKGNEGGGYLTLKRGESIELNAFIIPQENVTITDAWTIEVVLSDGTTFSKKLGAATGTATTATTLKPGEIHRLPILPALDIPANTQYDPSNWMVHIPRNTYLSEISIPGSWNSMNSDFQTVTDLAQQYAVGIRAFHLDTRWKWSRDPIGGQNLTSGEFGELGIADGSGSSNVITSLTDVETAGKVTRLSAPTFADALGTITKNVKKDEYMVLLCTFAQDNATRKSKTWMQAISETCASNADVYDASNLTKNTVVGDVLGKVIVIVNTEGTVPTTLTDSKCLFVNAPLKLTEDMFSTTGKYNTDKLHFGSGNASDISLLVSQAQIQSYNSTPFTNNDRGYAPTETQRTAQLNAILNWSKTNYADQINYNSSNWFYLGLGGYSARVNIVGDVKPTAPTGFSSAYEYIASTYNNWINNKVTNMSSRPTETQTNYYPVGIVLMNYVNNATYGTPVVNNILQLNNKFQKAYNPDWIGPVDSDNPATSRYQSSMKVDTNGWNVF